MACLCVSAQKSYVNMVSYHSSSETTKPNIYLTGEIPAGMDKTFIHTHTTGDVLNMLADEGFIVELHSMSSGASSGFYQTYLLSKSSSNTYNSVRSVQIDDEDITEVARYNLQGMPVNENEKGIQIIVYSNYTTKTVIVQ
jgi:hypothetical protein